MIIDEELIMNGITVPLLAKLIQKHEQEHERYRKLRRYYAGEHDILNRRKLQKGSANNKLMNNHAKYITDMTTTYLLGNPVTYSASENYEIEELKNAYLEQDTASIDFTLGKHCSIYGRAYELIYMSADSKPRSVVLSPWSAFVVYNDDCTHFPLFGVYYYKTHNVDGAVSGIVCNVYTDETERTYQSASDSWNSLELTYEGKHFFRKVPLIEYSNNEECQGDFEQLISNIDAYNTLQSDRVNDKEQFVDAFLFLTGIDLDSDQAKKLKEEKILMGYEGATAQYLNKSLNEADTKVLRDDIKDDIHRFSMVPDLSDESFGNNLSGVAIKYKLMGFEQHVKNKERIFAKGLKKRFELYNNILQTKGLMQLVPVHRVDIIFTHNLPNNNLEIAQMINYLKELVTQETLLGQLDFIGDAKEETKLAQKEATEKAETASEIVNRSWTPPSRNEE
ncbi:MAG: phage portal protein [Clostridia bacterium]|nr:phage portal protein [Clostridia bacterium]